MAISQNHVYPHTHVPIQNSWPPVQSCHRLHWLKLASQLPVRMLPCTRISYTGWFWLSSPGVRVSLVLLGPPKSCKCRISNSRSEWCDIDTNCGHAFGISCVCAVLPTCSRFCATDDGCSNLHLSPNLHRPFMKKEHIWRLWSKTSPSASCARGATSWTPCCHEIISKLCRLPEAYPPCAGGWRVCSNLHLSPNLQRPRKKWGQIVWSAIFVVTFQCAPGSETLEKQLIFKRRWRINGRL